MSRKKPESPFTVAVIITDADGHRGYNKSRGTFDSLGDAIVFAGSLYTKEKWQEILDRRQS